jgi:hypothetical protein
MKKLLVGWFSYKCRDRFGRRPLQLTEWITLAQGLRAWERRAMPLLNYTVAFALQFRKCTESISHCRRVVRDCALGRLVSLFKLKIGWPAQRQSTSVTPGWLQSQLLRYKCLPICRRKEFQSKCNLESNLSFTSLMLLGKDKVSKCS